MLSIHSSQVAISKYRLCCSVLLCATYCGLCNFLTLVKFIFHCFLHLINLLLVLQNSRSYDSLVHGKGTFSGWVEEVHEEAQLQEVIEGNN